MDKEKIEELKSKRLKLQEKVRLKDLRKRVASQISHLDKLGESYFVYYEFENLNWIDSNVCVRNRDGYRGIHGDFQIDVDDSNAISSYNISEEEINSEKFKEQFSSLISTGSTIIVCYQGGDPELEISAKAFLDKPTEFFSRPETWILTTDKKWIIEYIWEQGVIRFIQLHESTPTLVKKIIIEEK
jgi:hypothetical protein